MDTQSSGKGFKSCQRQNRSFYIFGSSPHALKHKNIIKICDTNSANTIQDQELDT